MKNFIEEGRQIVFTAGSNVSSGDVVALGDSLLGVAAGDVDNGDDGVANLEGVYSLKKKSGTAFTMGDKLYWHATDGLTKTNTDAPIGVAYADAASLDTSAQCKLIPGMSKP